MDFLEFLDVFKEDKGSMNVGRLKMTNQGVIFKNSKTGKVDNVQGSDVESIHWQRLASNCGIRIIMKSGTLYRFGGFVDQDQDRLSKFFKHNYDVDLKSRDLSLKGWNWGTAKFQGSVLSFNVEKTTAYEIPLGNVSHCATAKNEVTLEFHQNDDAAVSLMELRFHIPTDTSGADTVQAFHDNVMSKASIIQATGDAIAIFKELQCLTPRGRYDIKVFPAFIQLHGKTFDYKIPLTTVLRLFLLPHKDGRQMFFVLSLDPPIKQGQTRYHFLILLFNKEDEITLQVSLSEEDLKEKYEDKLQKEMSGLTFEVLSKIMKALVQRKITVPGSFVGHNGTQAITCSYRAGNGLLYPLERGLIYIHKPPVHIRFDEISSLNFARGGGSTRSFDIEVETKSGVVHTFSSIEKEEYGKLFDFASSKKLRIKNRAETGLSSKKKQEKPNYNEDDLVDSDVEDEPDAYLHRVKAEGREREEEMGGGSSDESSDVSFNPGESGSEVAEEFESNPSSSEDSDDNDAGDKKGSGGEDGKKKKEKKKSKSAKTVKEPGMRKKRVKKVKDENKPKRAASAYFIWLAEIREQIKKDNPGISITEISKKAGEMWKEVKDKSKWEKLAAEAKKEYEKAMADYKASGGGSEISQSPKNKSNDAKTKVKREVKESPSKSGSYKSKEYISSSSGSDDDKPLKKKEKKPSPKEEKKEKKETEAKKEKKSDDDEVDEEILSTPESSAASDKDEEMEEGSDDADD